MKITIHDSDAAHILDIGLDPENPLYEGCEMTSDSNLQPPWRLTSNDQAVDAVRKNALALLKKLPSNWLCLDGSTLPWVVQNVSIYARNAANTLFRKVGDKVNLIDSAPPATRHTLFS